MDNEKTFEITSKRDPFGLAGLPQLEPLVDTWPAIELALQRRQSRRRTMTWMASAAMIALAVGIYWQFPYRQPSIELAQPVALETPAPGAQPAESSTNNLDSLINLSQQLERNLRLIRSEVGVMPTQSLIYQVELEDLVAQIDEAINVRPDSQELWSQRVNLLLDLNQLYRTRLRRDYSHVASL